MIRILAAAGVLFAAAAANPALALDPTRETTQTTVSTRGVDFSDAEAVRTLYARLKTAAADVCTSAEGYSDAVRRADAACAEQSLARAVRQIGQPTLTAMYNNHGETYAANGR